MFCEGDGVTDLWKLIFRLQWDGYRGMGLLILLIFLEVQVADGVLTYLAIINQGMNLDAELNPFVRWVMSEMGIIPGLIVVKIVASGSGIILYKLRSYTVLLLMLVVYIWLVILPAVYLYFSLIK